MSGFKDMVQADNKKVFLDLDTFADKRTIIYDGQTYTDIPIVLSGLKQKDRPQVASDHTQGFFLATNVLHCAANSLNDHIPEKHHIIQINDEEGGRGFFYEYHVATSVCIEGMIRAELEAVDQ